MSILSKSQLIAQQASQWPNNNVGLITPEKLRDEVAALTNSAATQVENIDALRLEDVTNLESNALCVVLGYYANGDGGGGLFYYDSASVLADNGGTVIQPTVGVGRWIRVFSGEINALWFGVIGGGSTDTTINLQKAIDACAAITASSPDLYAPSVTLYLPDIGEYFKVTSTLTIPRGINIRFDGTICWSGNQTTPAIVIGSTTARNYHASIKLSIFSLNTPNWTDANHVGVKLLNFENCEVRIDTADKFTIGIQCLGQNSQGFIHNRICLGQIDSNQTAIDINSATLGWTNQNLFIGGKIAVNTNFDKQAYGAKLDGGANGNLFINTSFEMRDTEFAYPGNGLPVKIPFGSQNEFLGFRTEGNTNMAEISGSVSELNKFVAGYSDISLTTSRIIDTSTANTTVVWNANYLRGINSLGVDNIVTPAGLLNITGKIQNNANASNDNSCQIQNTNSAGYGAYFRGGNGAREVMGWYDYADANVASLKNTTGLRVEAPIAPKAYIVSGLPSPATVGAGAIVYVTDLTSITSGTTATGGGSLKHICASDGTNWIIQ